MATIVFAFCLLAFAVIQQGDARPSELDVLFARPSAVIYGFEHQPALSHRRVLLQTVSKAGNNGTMSVGIVAQPPPSSVNPSPPSSPTPTGKTPASGLFALPTTTNSNIGSDSSTGGGFSGTDNGSIGSGSAGTDNGSSGTGSSGNSSDTGTPLAVSASNINLVPSAQVSSNITAKTYSECSVFTADAALKCTGEVPIPACCDSTGHCYNNNNGIGGTCKQAAPLPGCCKAVDRPVDKCVLSSVGKSTLSFADLCTGNFPISACCSNSNNTSGSGTCHVNADATTPDCPATQGLYGCCPA